MTTEATFGSPGALDAGPSVRVRAIFIASFMTLIAAGMGFAIRGAILGDWSVAYGFTKSELGVITGSGLTGFGVTIIVCSLFADRIGYKPLLLGAFLLHALSAVLILSAGFVYGSGGEAAKNNTYWVLLIGCFMFSLGNGLCEAAINPLVATLYPRNKTHWLNILHAGWPAGLVLGALLAYLIAGPGAAIKHLPWQVPMAFFLVPTLWYGFIVLKERFPTSETHAAGVSLGDQFATVIGPIFIFLIAIHAMVGYVELGTDSWITNIMDNVIEGKSLLLFIYVSSLMFALRFFAGPIVHRINPLGLLFVAAVCGTIGLFMLGYYKTGGMIILGSTIFALGKTFYWPTMLGVAGEQFPKSGALGMGLLGGVGMLSAGLLGGPGIGYKQDRAASEYLQAKNDAAYTDAYNRYKAGGPNGFLFFEKITGLDGQKTGILKDNGAGLQGDIAALKKSGKTIEDNQGVKTMNDWWAGKDAGATWAIEGAASRARIAALSEGADAAKVAAADKKADEARQAALKDNPSAYAEAEVAAEDAKVKALSEGASAEKVKQADEAAAKAADVALAATPDKSVIGARAFAGKDRPIITEATVEGGQKALRITAVVPAVMAGCFLLLVFIFIARGGYKQIHLTGEQVSGGVEGPQEH